VKILKNVYEMVLKFGMLYGVELRGFDEGWEEIDKIHERICKIKS
jgi:hypothetical protein